MLTRNRLASLLATVVLGLSTAPATAQSSSPQQLLDGLRHAATTPNTRTRWHPKPPRTCAYPPCTFYQ